MWSGLDVEVAGAAVDDGGGTESVGSIAGPSPLTPSAEICCAGDLERKGCVG